jgi:hypothetical protein
MMQHPLISFESIFERSRVRMLWSKPVVYREGGSLTGMSDVPDQASVATPRASNIGATMEVQDPSARRIADPFRFNPSQ